MRGCEGHERGRGASAGRRTWRASPMHTGDDRTVGFQLMHVGGISRLDGTPAAAARRARPDTGAPADARRAASGDTLPTFTVDGVVAGLWWAEAVGGGRTHIEIEPFRPPLDRAAARALEQEGERLAELVAPLEPRVYARFQHWRPGRRG